MPFVQAASDLRTRLRRSIQLVPMLIGMLTGGLALSLVCDSLSKVAEVIGVFESPPEVTIFISLVLIMGDILAIYRNTLYPLTVRRQARQSLSVAFSKEWIAPFVWGVDAGFSLFTYRVTSGLWLCLAAVFFGFVSSLYLLLYATAFATAFWLWAVVGSCRFGSFSADIDRVRLLVEHRVRAQKFFATVAIAAGIVTAVT